MLEEFSQDLRHKSRLRNVFIAHQIECTTSDIPKLCSPKHLQVLRKEIGKKNKTNVTRSENCEFVRPWTVYRQGLVRNNLTHVACCEAVYTASIIDLSCMSCVNWDSLSSPAFSEPRETSRTCTPRVSSHLQPVAWAFSRKSKRIKTQCSVIYFWVLLVRAFQLKLYILLRSDLPSLGRNTCPLQVFRAPT